MLYSIFLAPLNTLSIVSLDGELNASWHTSPIRLEEDTGAVVQQAFHSSLLRGSRDHGSDGDDESICDESEINESMILQTP